MDLATINTASKLNYELRMIRGAMALFNGTDNVAIRVSCPKEGSDTDKLFAYLSKSVIPQVQHLLTQAEKRIMNQMEKL